MSFVDPKYTANFTFTINYSVQSYRQRFLKRKNVNGYKKSPFLTPENLDKAINALDRKIKGKSIFTDEVKLEYFKGLQEVFNEFYTETFWPKMSRRQAYYKYRAECHCVLGKHSIKMTYKEFVASGRVRVYKSQ